MSIELDDNFEPIRKLSFQARLAISGPRDILEYKQYIAGAALIADPAQERVTADGNWEMLECEIIVIPRKRYQLDSESLKNGRLDQIVQVLSKDKYWKEKKS